MNYNQCLHILQQITDKYVLGDVGQAIKMAIGCVNKQIPKRLLVCRTSGGQEGYMCPSCHTTVLKRHFTNDDYCRFCGQKINRERV